MVPTAFQHQDVVTQVFLVPTKYHQNKALYIYIYTVLDGHSNMHKSVFGKLMPKASSLISPNPGNGESHHPYILTISDGQRSFAKKLYGVMFSSSLPNG